MVLHHGENKIRLGDAANLAFDNENKMLMLDVISLDKNKLQEQAPHLLSKSEIPVSPVFKARFFQKHGVHDGREYEGIHHDIEWEEIAIIDENKQSPRCKTKDGCKVYEDAGIAREDDGIKFVNQQLLNTQDFLLNKNQQLLNKKQILRDADEMSEKVDLSNYIKKEDVEKLLQPYKEQIQKYQEAERQAKLGDVVKRVGIKEDAFKDKNNDHIAGFLHAIEYIGSAEYQEFLKSKQGAADAEDTPAEIRIEKIKPKSAGEDKYDPFGFAYIPEKFQEEAK